MYVCLDVSCPITTGDTISKCTCRKGSKWAFLPGGIANIIFRWFWTTHCVSGSNYWVVKYNVWGSRIKLCVQHFKNVLFVQFGPFNWYDARIVIKEHILIFGCIFTAKNQNGHCGEIGVQLHKWHFAFCSEFYGWKMIKIENVRSDDWLLLHAGTKEIWSQNFSKEQEGYAQKACGLCQVLPSYRPCWVDWGNSTCSFAHVNEGTGQQMQHILEDHG